MKNKLRDLNMKFIIISVSTNMFGLLHMNLLSNKVFLGVLYVCVIRILCYQVLNILLNKICCLLVLTTLSIFSRLLLFSIVFLHFFQQIIL